MARMRLFDVGGVGLMRPFRIQRLGHVGLNFRSVAKALPFYRNLLGLRISDRLDHLSFAPHLASVPDLGETQGVMLRHGSDHYALALMPERARRLLNPALPADVTINRLSWQLACPRELAAAAEWLVTQGAPVTRQGRNFPGSNYSVYSLDPDGHTIELFYGMEQIGWDGRSKPSAAHRLGTHRAPDLPCRPEYEEIADIARSGTDLHDGTCSLEEEKPCHDVGGVLLPRPFRVTGLGPARLFVSDVDASAAFYTGLFGLTLTETVDWQGHRCHFLRVNGDHHVLALYPRALRDELGLSPHTTCLSVGLRVHDYTQLRAAMRHLERAGSRIWHLPGPLCPGIEYSAFAQDPEGHSVQLYFAMEQIGWDGRPRPAASRSYPVPGQWPDRIEAASSLFQGEVFPGPWA